MPKDKETPVADGDELCVLIKEYPFKINIKETRKRKIKEDPSSEESIVEEQPTKKPKRNESETKLEEKEAKPVKAPKNTYSIAMPSISTGTFQFDVDKAVQIACDEIGNFLRANMNSGIRIYLLDISNSIIIKKFKEVKCIVYRGGDITEFLCKGN